MDPLRQPSERFDQRDSDADIGRILLKTGQTFKHALKILYRGIVRFFHGILLTILFLLRNIVWLIAGTAIGLGYGIYLMQKKGTKYQSEMTVKANFNSSKALYNTVEYLNASIAAGRTDEIQRIFTLSDREASSIVGFYIEPVESEIIKADMYHDMFLQNMNPVIGTDTLWMKTVTYHDFKNSLTNYDYPYYDVSVTATSPVVFGKLRDGIAREMSEIPLLKEERDNQISSNLEAQKNLKNAISSIDTLRQAYNQRLAHGQPLATPQSNQLTVLQSSPDLKTPELDLYDKLLFLQDQLNKTKSRSVTEKNVIEIIAPFSAIGQKVSFFRQSVVKYATMGFVAAVVILLLIALYRILAKMEKRTQVA